MQFTELMILHSAPLYWEPRPSFHAKQLRGFLLYLLDPDKRGYGALLDERALRDESVPAWREDDAIQWIEDAYEQVWLQGANALEDYGKKVSQTVFDTLYTKRKATVFLDAERLEACLEANVPDRTCISFSVDWSFIGSVVWTPQLRICNYWPHASSLAPDPPAGVFSPPSPPM